MGVPGFPGINGIPVSIIPAFTGTAARLCQDRGIDFVCVCVSRDAERLNSVLDPPTCS